MPSVAAAERSALSDLFLEVGPNAPTLSGEWTTRDLAAHLVIRERRPDAAAGIVARPLEGYSEKVRLAEAERPYTEIVDRVRKGPPRWSPMRIDAIDQLANTLEFFVHHEDVRRAQPTWAPRPLAADVEDVLASSVSKAGRMLARKAPAGVVLERPGGPSIRLHKGEPTVAIVGPIAEGILFVFGRTSVAQVELDGPAAAVAAIRAHSFGF